MGRYIHKYCAQCLAQHKTLYFSKDLISSLQWHCMHYSAALLTQHTVDEYNIYHLLKMVIATNWIRLPIVQS